MRRILMLAIAIGCSGSNRHTLPADLHANANDGAFRDDGTFIHLDSSPWCAGVAVDAPCYLSKPECEEFTRSATDVEACVAADAASCFTATYRASGKASVFCARVMDACQTMRGIVISKGAYTAVRDCALMRYVTK